MHIWLTSALFFAAPAYSADANAPHPHQGVAEKFTNPQRTTLSTEEEQTLTSGESIRRQYRDGDASGRGLAIMDVQGTPDDVWNVILDFDSYPNWIDQLSSCQTYQRTGDQIYVHFLIKTMGISVEYFIKHTHNASAGHLTWTLDYSRESDLDDSTGYWLVYPTPNRDGYTRVEYTVDLRVKGWVPGFIEDMLANRGLDDATNWVRKQVESN